jgi:hypothetical protein
MSNDARFSNVEVYVYTGLDGSIAVRGFVRSDPELAALKQLVQSTNPPTAIAWKVRVFPDD